MLKTLSPQNSRPYLMGFMLVFSLFALGATGVKAQSVAVARSNSAEGHSLPLEASETAKKAPKTVPNVKKPVTTEEKLDALAQMVEQQNERLNQLQQTISEQQETIRLLRVEAQQALARYPTYEFRRQYAGARRGDCRTWRH